MGLRIIKQSVVFWNAGKCDSSLSLKSRSSSLWVLFGDFSCITKIWAFLNPFFGFPGNFSTIKVCIHFHSTSRDTCCHGWDFHFVSYEDSAVETELNMPRGHDWDRCLIFRGKQTHTGSRHGCHISLSSPVSPEGGGQGQPLRWWCHKNPHVLIWTQQYTDRHVFVAHRQKGKSICCLCCACCTDSLQRLQKQFLSFSPDQQSDLTSWKAAHLVPKPGSIFNFPRLISDHAGAEQLYSFTSARRRFSGFQ